MTLSDLYRTIRHHYPDLASYADQRHLRLFGELDEEDHYQWFASLADALNAQMDAGADASPYVPMLQMLDHALDTASDEVHQCIDTSFMEQLFWQVASVKAAPFWAVTPHRLRRLYVAFFGYEPCPAA